MKNLTPGDDEVSQVLEAWRAAHRAAEPNATIMCSRPTAEQVNACAARMQVLGRAEERLFSLSGCPDLPPLLQAFFDATADRGCARCWFSSSKGRNHPECNEKICRWFRARDALMVGGS